jgi:hypothetical protein
MALSLVAAVLAAVPPHWNAPPGCPDADALVQRIERLAGRVPEGDDLRAAVAIDGPPWRATIELSHGDVMERRIVEADACAGLLDATAVVIAVAMDPALVVRRHEHAFAPTNGDGVPTAVDTNGARAPSVDARRDPLAEAPGRPPRASLRVNEQDVGIRVGAGVGVGGWDRAAGGFEIALAWSRNALGVELVGRYWIPRRDTLEDRGAVRIELGTIAAQLCWRGGRQRWSFAACGGVEAGDFVVEGVAAPARARVHFPWVAPIVGGRVGLRARRPLVLWLGVEAAVPVTRLQATLRAVPPIVVYDAGAPAVRALAGIELRWSLAPRSRAP